MSRLKLALAVLLLPAGAGAFETTFLMAPLSAGRSERIEVVKDQVIVRVEGSTLAFSAATAAGGGAILAELGSGWISLRLPGGMDVVQGVEWVRSLPGVKFADFDRAYRPIATTDDPLLGSQWGLTQINARQAWDYETGNSARVTIGVIDSGVEKTHVDLSTRMANTASRSHVGGVDIADEPPTVVCNHGTRVAGIAAAAGNNGAQMAGVAWGTGIQIISYRVFPNTCSADCSTSCTTNDAALIAAIQRAQADSASATYGRMILNMSLGAAGSCADALQTAVTNAVANNVIIVAATGNDGAGVQSPANCSGVIPVGATDAAGNVASFSSRGPSLATGGLVAPGVSVLSTTPGNTTVSGISGTSFAAPHVAGAAALVLAAKPNYTPSQVLATLRNSADPVGFGTAEGQGFKTAGNTAGAGRLNAFLAVQLAVKGQLADFQGEDKVVAFPNPFRSDRHQNVTFAFPPSIQAADDVKVKIYTMDGTLVRDLNSLTWNIQNDEGKPVASGTYLFVVSTSKGKRTGRVSVIR